VWMFAVSVLVLLLAAGVISAPLILQRLAGLLPGEKEPATLVDRDPSHKAPPQPTNLSHLSTARRSPIPE